jgi:hydrogenase maturation protease
VIALVIGYGNPLRSDDAIGWHVAERLATDPRVAEVEILRRHQLTPELALDVSRVDLVVLIDARAGPAAGVVSVERVDATAATRSTWSHHLGPASLAALAVELYGRSGDVHVVSIGVGSLDVGEQLSAEVAGAIDVAADAVVRILAGASADREPVPEIVGA